LESTEILARPPVALQFYETSASLLSRGGDRALGAARAIRLHLAGLYLRGLDALGQPGDALSLEQRAELMRATRTEAMDVAVHAREQGQVLDALASRGIRPVLFKGENLARAAWPDPALRPAGDIDLLLEPDLLEEAVSALAAKGYRPVPGERPNAFRPTPIGVGMVPPAGRAAVVDLQIHLFRSVGHRVAARDLLARARLVPIGSATVRELDPVDNLQVILVHAAKHGLRHPKWLLDLFGLSLRAEEADWQEVLRRCRKTSTERPVFAAARVLSELPATRLPPLFEKPLAPSRPIASFLGAIFSAEHAANGTPLRLWERYALELLLEPSLRARARMAAGLLYRLIRFPLY